MEKVLIDTDVVIDFLRGYNFRLKGFFKKIQKREISGLISVVSVLELHSGKDIENKKRLVALEQLLALLEPISLDLSGAKLAGNWRRKYGLGLADSVIAVTSFQEKAFLFTFNQKHFRKIADLKLYGKSL